MTYRKFMNSFLLSTTFASSCGTFGIPSHGEETPMEGVEGASSQRKRPRIAEMNPVPGDIQQISLMDLPDEVLLQVLSHVPGRGLANLAQTSQGLKDRITKSFNLSSLEEKMARDKMSPKRILALGVAGCIPFTNDLGGPGFGTQSWSKISLKVKTSLIHQAFSENNPTAQSFIGQILSEASPLPIPHLMKISGIEGFDSPSFTL